GVHEDRPGAVVKAPAIAIEADDHGLHDISDFLRYRGVARRWILDVEERLREAIKIVDRARVRHRGYRGDGRIPMRGDHQNRARPRHGDAECLPRLRKMVRFESVHWAPMP